MPKPQTKPAVLRESWRPNNVAQLRAQKQQLAVRLTFTALLCGLVVLSLYLIFTPLFHPTTRLYFLTAGANRSTDSAAAPIAFFQDDALRFLTSTGSLTPETAIGHLLFMESPDAFKQAMGKVVSSVSNPNDVTVAHVAVHPWLINQRPYLRCDNFEPSRPLEGAIACEELFDQLSSITTGHVVLLLDMGCPSDQQALLLDDAVFFDQLEDLALAHASSNFSVIASHSPGEQSYRSTSFQCSVFALAASLGLSGLADLNSDRRITADEFVRFVSGSTQAIVQQESGAAASQHPRLLAWGAQSQSQLSALVIGSAPPMRSNKLAERHGLSSGSALPASVSSSLVPDAKSVAKGSEESVDSEQKQTFRSSMTDYVSRKSEELGDDLRNDLNLLIIGLPKPLARGVRRSVDEAQKLTDKSEAEKSEADDKQASPEETPAAGDKADASSADATTDASQRSTGKAADSNFVLTAPGFPDLTQMADSDILGLLRLAWDMTAYLERTDSAAWRPVDLAPVAWLRWRSHLHATEDRIRAGAMIDQPQTRLELTSEILGAYQLASGKPATVGANMKSVSKEVAPLAIPLSTIISLGQAKNLKQFGLLTLPLTLDTAIDEFDRCLKADERGDLDKWLAESAPAETAALAELFNSRRLLSQSMIPWSTVRPVLQAHRDYEKLVSHPLCNNAKMMVELAEAHRYLLQATRLALDHVSEDWNSRTLQALTEAQTRLASVDRRRRVVQEAWQWRNQVLLDVPAMMAWQQIHTQRFGQSTAGNSSVGWSVAKELPLLLNDVASMTAMLRARESVDSDQVESLLRVAQQRGLLIRRSWLTEYEALLARNGDAKAMMASDAWVVDSLLASTIVIGPERKRLLQWRSKPARLPELTAQSSLSAGRAGANSLPATSGQASLLLQLIQLGELKAPGVEESWALSETFSQLRVAVPSLMSKASGQSLPDRLQSLRQADLLQRLSWQSPALDDAAPSFNSELWRAEFANGCGARQRLVASVIDDAGQEELRYWPDVQLRLSQLESTLSGQNSRPMTRSNQIVGQGSTSLSLVTNAEDSGRIIWKNTGADVGNVWLIVDYDQNNLQLEADTTLPFYTTRELSALLTNELSNSEQQLVNQLAAPAKAALNPQDNDQAQQTRLRIESIKNCLLYPIRPLPGGIEPSAGLAAGQTLSIPFKIRRIGTGVGQSKIVWKLVSGREYVRYEIPINRADSKQLRLVSDGPSQSWTENADGVVFHPWPNRPSEFRVGLVNEGAARVLGVELLRLSQRGDIALPNGFVDASLSQEIINRLGSVELLQAIPDVSMPEAKTPVWLAFPAANDKDKPAPKSDASASLPAIQQGLVVVLTNKESGEKLYRRIDFRVRHPRGYVEPRLRYDAISERLFIQLRQSEGQKLPSSGINVHGEVLSAMPGGMEKRLDGVLTSASPLELSCQMPPRPGRKLTISLDVDQFPRAFTFDVPCWQTQNDIPLTLDQQRITITDPKDGLLLPATAQSQAVTLQVDAYPGSFATSRDVIEIGWDLDRDREFTGESTLKVHNDRSVAVELVQFKGDHLVVTARVKDLEVLLPAPSLRAANLSLLARMSAAGETVWSDSINVVADDQAPVITGVELTPDIVMKQGADLTLIVGVEDHSLSGLALVQFQVDRKLNGSWDPAGEIIACERNAEGSWTGVLPTKALVTGRVPILVQATDRAGNVSKLGKTHFELVSPSEWEARQAIAGIEVTGSISYSGGPLSGARLTLENEKGEIAFQTRANAQGIFQFPKVNAGKYKLIGTGVAKNRPKKSEVELEVKELSDRPVRLQLKAK